MTDTKILGDQDQAMAEIEVMPTVDDILGVPEYELRVSSDRVCVELDCPDPHSDLDNLIARIITDFKLLEIPEYPDAEILKNILSKACRPGEHLRDHVIMMGQKAIPHIDGRLEWTEDYFAEGWTVDEDSGNIDFWSKLERRSVKENELLVRLYPPVDGKAGLNVFGNEIPVTKPNKVKLRSGKNVHTVEEDDCTAYHATCNGRVRLADGTVAVDDVYVIKGNVSLETGNIIHTGAVMIQGDVGTGATIEADGDIMVKGMLEPCHIKCGGSLTVVGGIVGDEDYSIELAGDLMAKYISEANIEAQGNIVVGNEIAHSRIYSLGQVKVPRGRIAGGTTLAKLGIRVGEAGSSGASDTELIAGVDYTLEKKILWQDEKILKLEEAQDRIQKAVKVSERNQDLTEKEITTLNGLKKKVSNIAQAIADAHMLIQKLKVDAINSCVAEIFILKELWSGTKIRLGNERTIVRASVLKPRIIQLRRRKIKILPLGDGNMPDE